MNFSWTETSDYVYHPINAFRLLKRTAIWMPKIIKHIPSLNFKYDIPTLLEECTRALHGLADIIEYYDVDPKELAKGRIKNELTNEVYVSKSTLNSGELLKMAHESKAANYLDGYVNLLIAALKEAKLEKKDLREIKAIR